MSDDFDFSLGDGTEEEEVFSLGGEADDSVTTGEETGTELELTEVTASQESEESSDGLPMDINRFYATFIEGHENKDDNYFVTFTQNIESYLAVGLKPFQDPSIDDVDRIKELKEEYLGVAIKKWERVRGEQIPRFEKAIDDLVHLFTDNAKKYRMNLKNPLHEHQLTKLKAAVKTRCDDNILDSEELVSLIGQATEYGLCNTPEEKKEIIGNIKEFAQGYGAKINSYQEDFVSYFQSLEPNARMDLPECRDEVFNQFNILYKASESILGDEEKISDENLLSAMDKILAENNLSFKSNVVLFEEEKFHSFISENAIDLSKAVPLEHIFALKGIAKDNYSFSEEQWNTFVREHGIKLTEEKKISFILGMDENDNPLTAESVTDIPALFDKAPSLAKSKLFSGELEVYLNSVDRSDLREKIKSVRKDYAADQNSGLIKSKYILDESLPCRLENGVMCSDKKEIALKMEEDYLYYKTYFSNSNVKSLSSQLWLEVHSAPQVSQDVRTIMASSYPAEKKLNSVLLALSDYVYQKNGKAYKMPSDLVKEKDKAFVAEVIRDLQNDNSKLCCWINGKFKELVPCVTKWRDLHFDHGGNISYTYALEPQAPFYFNDKKFFSVNELEMHLLDNKKNSAVTEKFIQPEFLRELGFWAKNYKESSLQDILIWYINQVRYDKELSGVFLKLMDVLIGCLSEAHRADECLFKAMPFIKVASKNGIISEADYEKNRDQVVQCVQANKGPATDKCVATYLEREVRSNPVDKKLVSVLLSYYVRAGVDRIFYEKTVSPIVEEAKKIEAIDDGLYEKLGQFFANPAKKQKDKLFVQSKPASLEDLFKPLKDRPNKKQVYFCRINKYSDEVSAFISKMYSAALRNGVIFESKLPIPEPKSVASYQSIMGMDFKLDFDFMKNSLKKWIPAIPEETAVNIGAVVYSNMETMSKSGKAENILKNLWIKIMCWLKFQFEGFVAKLGNDDLPKILFDGTPATHDLMMLSVLSASGCDVVLVQKKGDADYLKLDPKSQLSTEMEIKGGSAFPESFNFKQISENVQQNMQADKLNRTNPSALVCTNTWVKGKILDSIIVPVSERGKENNTVYNLFARVQGVEDKNNYAQVLFGIQDEIKKQGRTLLVVNNNMDRPTPQDVAEIKRGNYETTDKMIADMAAKNITSQNAELKNIIHKAFVTTLLAEAKKEGNSLNKLTNKAVYLLCWLKKYEKQIFQNWKLPQVAAFIYLGGCKNDNEALFMTFLAKMPVDVLILCPDNAAQKCCLNDKALLEEGYPGSLQLTCFPETLSQIKMGTVAFHAEKELDSVIYQGTGIYRNQQFAKANTICLQTMYEEIKILWNEELKYRPNFSEKDGVVNVPVLCAKVSGIKDGKEDAYWDSIRELNNDDTFIIKEIPFIENKTPNPFMAFATDFYKNGRLQKTKIKEHPKYPYGILREEMQDFMLEKLDLLIKRKLVKGIGENGTEYTAIAQILNLPKEIVRLIQKFDFTKTNPKLILIGATEKTLSLEDSIILAFLNLIGFDLLLFAPTGYQCEGSYLAFKLMEEHQIGTYVYDLTVPDLSSNLKKSTSWKDKIFGRGK